MLSLTKEVIMNYKHLTQEERYYINVRKSSGDSLRKIAKDLQRSPSTITREVNRNTGQKGYRHKQAQKLMKERQKNSHKPRISGDIWKEVLARLEQDHSPDQISNALKIIGMNISHERIYLFLETDKKAGGEWYKHLRCQRKKKRRYAKPDRRGSIKDRVNISERPKEVETRESFGHWEADLVETYKGGAVFVTLLERKSRFYLALRIPDKRAETVKNGIISLLLRIKEIVHTITFDNGKEFAYHSEVARILDCKTYFANPYSSWERGANENANGLLRQYFPKGKDTSHFTDKYIAETILKINKRPRKCINYQKPFNLIRTHLQSVALTS